MRAIGDIELARLTPMDIENALVTLAEEGGRSKRKKLKPGEMDAPRPLADRTMHHAFALGKRLMKHAVRNRLISENPFDFLDAPRVIKKPLKIASNAQVEKLYRVAVKNHESGKHPGADLLVALFTTMGIRRSEVLGLAWDAIDLEDRTMRVFRTVVAAGDGSPIFREGTKTEDSTRTLSLPDALIPLLRRHKAFINEMALKWGKGYQREPMLLFPDHGGVCLRPSVLTMRLRQFQRQARVTGITPTHSYRHGNGLPASRRPYGYQDGLDPTWPCLGGLHDGLLCP